MSWSESLIKLATYEVEVRQKRLAEAVARRVEAEAWLVRLESDVRLELSRSDADPATAIYRAQFMQAVRLRRADAAARIAELKLEEQGARDALAAAFEAQKKYEHVAEQARLVQRKAEVRRETAALDELGLRKAAR